MFVLSPVSYVMVYYVKSHSQKYKNKKINDVFNGGGMMGLIVFINLSQGSLIMN